MVLPIGPIITGVGSVIGGLLGGSEKTNTKSHTRTRSRSSSTTRGHLQQMVAAAEKNGFNPLTLLRAGGLASYSTTTGTSFSNSKGKNSGTTTSTAPLAAGIAGAAGAIGGSIENNPDQWGLANAFQAGPGAGAVGAAQEYDALQAQLDKVAPGTLGDQPRVPVSSTFKAKPALGDGSDGSVLTPTFERPTVTNPWPQGSGMGVNPRFSDAEMMETRYGGSEIAEMIAGGIVAGGDLYHGAKQGYEHFMNTDAPVMKKRAGEIYNSIVAKNSVTNALGMKVTPGGGPELPTWNTVKGLGQNIWDPPAITVGVTPVVKSVPVPSLWDRAKNLSPW